MTQRWGNDFAVGGSFSRDSQNETSTNDNAVGATTPQYVIVGDIFHSMIDGEYKESGAPCLSFDIRRDRRATYDSSGENSGDGRMTIYNTIVLMRYGWWAPQVLQALDTGRYIAKLWIKRFTTLNNTKVIIQDIFFDCCAIKSYHQKEDIIAFSFAFKACTDTTIPYNPEGGEIAGGRYSWMFEADSVKGEGKK